MKITHGQTADQLRHCQGAAGDGAHWPGEESILGLLAFTMAELLACIA